jgi:cytochrome b6-f complex iron-sulfur subunit
MSETKVSDANTPISRRRFCAGACQVASGATLATLFTSCGGSPTSPSGGGGGASPLGVVSGRFTSGRVEVTIAGTALAADGGAVVVDSVAGVFLLSRTGASAFTAVEGICTHEGCRVTDADGDNYVCPCHGSRYTRSGTVVRGPAVASLRRYSTNVVDGVVTIAV